MTEKGSSTLVWLERHPKPGTPKSRAAVARASKYRIWAGFRAAGFAWRNRSHTDIDPSSPAGCLHVHESVDWHIHNPPYDGGMQEDRGFQLTYGAEFDRLWGYASAWPPWAQLMAAFRAYHGYHGYGARGYTPWSTAGACGL